MIDETHSQSTKLYALNLNKICRLKGEVFRCKRKYKDAKTNISAGKKIDIKQEGEESGCDWC